MKKKYYFILSCVALFLGIFINTSLVNAASSLADVQSEINAAQDGVETTVDLNFPATTTSIGTISVPAGKEIVLDGKGIQYTAANSLLTTEVEGKLTLKNLRISGGNRGITLIAKTDNSEIIADNIDIQNLSDGGIGPALNFQTYTAAASVTVQNSTFKNNECTGSGFYGGAIISINHRGNFTLKNSTLIGNKVTKIGTGAMGGEGGAIFIREDSQSRSITFENNHFQGNCAVEDASGSQGKLADGGAIALWNVKAGTSVLFDGNTFDSNIAGDDGGAVLVQTQDTITDSVVFNNNTFYKNEARGADTSVNTGGAIQVYANSTNTSQFTVRIQYYNNSFVGNVATKYAGGAVGHHGHFNLSSFKNNVSAGYYENNLFVGNTSGTAEKNNIADQPNVPNTGDGGDNIGFDNGTLATETLQDVFGTAQISLVPNYNKIESGATYAGRMAIPTLPIVPEKLADNKITDLKNGSATDQRAFTRGTHSDIGSIEVNYIKFDVNHPDAYFGLSTLTTYDGTEYYEKDAIGDIKAYYQVGHTSQQVDKKVPEPKKVVGTDIFLGWSTDEGATTPDPGWSKDEIPNKFSLNDQTLYGVWGKAPVNITYHANGGENPPSDSTDYNVGDDVIVKDKEDMSRPGYVFLGWGDSPDATTPIYPVGETITNIQTSMDLYAVWQAVQSAPVTVEYWEYDADGNAVGKIADDAVLTGNYLDRYHAEANYIAGFVFAGVLIGTDLSPISGILSDQPQTVKLSYYRIGTEITPPAESNQGIVLAQYQDEEGHPISADVLQMGTGGSKYTTSEKTIEGYTFDTVVGNPTGFYTTNVVTVVTYIYKSSDDNLVPEEVLQPVWRAYNLNDGDHLYTISREEYDWIVGLGWQAEDIAFYSVMPEYENAIKVYRLYNPNSGEHFYTLSENEYDDVATKGWRKEGIAFYMVPKEMGHTIYRVFNPNTTGPGSHLYTKSRTEASWLISLGWVDEGIAFYSAK